MKCTSVLVGAAALVVGACTDSAPVTDPALRSDVALAASADGLHDAGAVYIETNAAAENRVVVYHRAADGTLRQGKAYRTGGRGTGVPKLGSQHSVLLSPDDRWLFVANSGSGEISVFAVGDAGRDDLREQGDGDAGGGRGDDPRRDLTLVDKVPSGGQMPLSIALRDRLLYVVNAGGEAGGRDNITAFTVTREGRLSPVSESTRPLSESNTEPAEIVFSPDGGTLVVTERATNSIDTYVVGAGGVATGPAVHPSSGLGPFGFAFRHDGVFVVTESFNGAPGHAAASSYRLTGSSTVALITGTLQDTQSDVCWTVITRDERYAYVTNNGTGTISSYWIAPDGTLTLRAAVAGVTGSPGGFGARDEDLSNDGHYLYAIDVGTHRVNAFAVNGDGSLTKLGEVGGLPPTLAGLAAR